MSRNPILSQKKLKEEGILSAQQVILRWLINTRMLKLFIIKDKACRILIELKDMVKWAEQKMAVHRKNLDSIIGKLNNTAFIVPEGRFFLNHLWYWHKVAPIGRGHQYFDSMEKEDLKLWMTIVHNLSDGNIGCSTNSLQKTIASILTTTSDTSQHGLGGLIIINRIAFVWRFELLHYLLGIFLINLLEFIATYWCIRAICKFITGEKILAISDSMNSLAWLDSNKHNPHLQPMHNTVAKAVGKDLLQSDNSLMWGHVEGNKNKITDSFSQDTNIPFNKLIKLLQCHKETAGMLPERTEIFEENGEELSLWLQSLVQNSQKMQVVDELPKRSGLFTGRDGKYSVQPSTKRTIFSETSQLKETLTKELSLKHQLFLQKTLASNSRTNNCRSLRKVGEIFEDNNLRNLIQFIWPIKTLIHAYHVHDPPSKRQASLPISIFRDHRNIRNTPFAEAVGQLTTGALAFAMWSCEYSTMSEKNPKTKQLWLWNSAFYTAGGTKMNKFFHTAKYVKNTF